jgi:hypothetical protein
MEDAPVAHQRAAPGHGDNLSKRRDAVSQCHAAWLRAESAGPARLRSPERARGTRSGD